MAMTGRMELTHGKAELPNLPELPHELATKWGHDIVDPLDSRVMKNPSISASRHVNWAHLPFDLLGNVVLRSSFWDGVKLRKTVCPEWSRLPEDFTRLIFPADIVPLLLNCSDHGTFEFYDPDNNILFDVAYPDSRTIGRLCDFRQQKLLTIIPDGVHLLNILTGARFSWVIASMPSDSYILSSCGNNVRSVIATKGSASNTIVAVLKKLSKREHNFWTHMRFTVSSLSNPILSEKKLFCLSTEGGLGVFDLENNISSIYYDDDKDDEDDDDDNDDEDDNDDDEEEEDLFHDFVNPAEFLCGSEGQMYKILIEEGWGSLQVKKLEKPAMYWSDVDELGERAIHAS